MIRFFFVFLCCSCTGLFSVQAVETQNAESVRDAARARLAHTRAEILTRRQHYYDTIHTLQEELEESSHAEQELEKQCLALTDHIHSLKDQANTDQKNIHALIEQVAHLCQSNELSPQTSPHELAEKCATTITAHLQTLSENNRIHFTQKEIRDRNGAPITTTVLQMGAVYLLAAGTDDSTSGYIHKTEGGSLLIAGEPFTAAQHQQLQELEAGTGRSVPCDVSGTLSTRERAAAWSLKHFFDTGGLFLWPIIAVMIIALVLVLERIISLSSLRAPPKIAHNVLTLLHAEKYTEAHNRVKQQKTPMERILAIGLQNISLTRETREAQLEAALLKEEPLFERNLSLLAVLAAVAPLLGLLGTVTGMIGTFEVIAVNGTGNPRLLSGGISEALVTTQMGLIVAVPILLAHAWISRIVDRRQVVLEQAATALLGETGPEEIA